MWAFGQHCLPKLSNGFKTLKQIEDNKSQVKNSDRFELFQVATNVGCCCCCCCWCCCCALLKKEKEWVTDPSHNIPRTTNVTKDVFIHSHGGQERMNLLWELLPMSWVGNCWLRSDVSLLLVRDLHTWVKYSLIFMVCTWTGYKETKQNPSLNVKSGKLLICFNNFLFFSSYRC